MAEPTEIVTVNSTKKIFFTVTQEGEVLISNEQGHIEVYNFNGFFR